MTLAFTNGGEDMHEWAIALGGLLGGGGITGVVAAILGRRGQRVDALAKLEQIATGIAEKATAAADVRAAAADSRVEHVEQQLAVLKRDADAAATRRRVAAAAHAMWDEQVAATLRDLGGSVPPPPPLEVP